MTSQNICKAQKTIKKYSSWNEQGTIIRGCHWKTLSKNMPIYKNNIIKFKNTAERRVGGRGGQRSILRRAEILATVCLSRLNQSKLRLSPSVIKLPVSRTMSDGNQGCYSGQSLEELRDGNHKNPMEFCLVLLNVFHQCFF